MLIGRKCLKSEGIAWFWWTMWKHKWFAHWWSSSLTVTLRCTVNSVDCRRISQTSQTASLQLWPDVTLFFLFRQEPCCAISTRALQRSTLTKKENKKSKHILGVSNVSASVTGPCYHLRQQDCFFWHLDVLDMFFALWWENTFRA